MIKQVFLTAPDIAYNTLGCFCSNTNKRLGTLPASFINIGTRHATSFGTAAFNNTWVPATPPGTVQNLLESFNNTF